MRILFYVALMAGAFLSCAPHGAKAPAQVKTPGVVHPSVKVPLPSIKPPQPQAPPVKPSQTALEKLLSGKEFLLEVRNPDLVPQEQDEILGPIATLGEPAAKTAYEFLTTLVKGKVAQELLDPSWASYLSAVLETELKGAGKLTGFRLGAWEASGGSEELRAPFWVEGKGRAFGTIYVDHTEKGWKVSDVQGDLTKASEPYTKPKFSAAEGIEKNPWRIF